MSNQDEWTPIAANRSDFHFAIVGGGICGLVLAVAMLRRGLKVDIYEQAHELVEIGAGFALGPNATHALNVCSPDLLASFNRIVTWNQSPEKRNVWFEFMDGYHTKENGETSCFKLENELGQNAAHRANFVEELVKLIPNDICHLGKCLDRIFETLDARLRLDFVDGSHTVADAVIGCDGIKSRTRQILFGAQHPSAVPAYTHRYAYRGLVPMNRAIESLGEDIAGNSHVHMGPNGHVLTFPIDNGAIMNVVAFVNDPEDWPDHSKFTLPSAKSQAVAAFKGFNGTVASIIGLLEDPLHIWAAFDLGHNPLPTYCKGRVCLLGDSAHASTPHHGAGAGMGLEDAAVLADLLFEVFQRTNSSTSKATVAKNVEHAFQAYDTSRRERTQWLVQSSRYMGELYEWRVQGIADDKNKIYAEIKATNEKIWNGDVLQFTEDAKKHLLQKIR